MRTSDIQYNIPAKPTEYAGVQFRSRLEARWAAFFDLLGWEWDYEPPIQFRYWTPDFLLKMSRAVYVEVKPIERMSIEVMSWIDVALPPYAPDDPTSDEWGMAEAMVVGNCLPRGEAGHKCVGWLRDMGEWGFAPFGRWMDASDGTRRIGFCHETRYFRDRVTGGYDGGCFGAAPFDESEVETLWRQAGNTVQYINPKWTV